MTALAAILGVLFQTHAPPPPTMVASYLRHGPVTASTEAAPANWTTSMVAAWNLDEASGTRVNNAGSGSCGGTGTNCDLNTCTTGVTQDTTNKKQGAAAISCDGTGACSCAGGTCTALTSALPTTFTLGLWGRSTSDTGAPQYVNAQTFTAGTQGYLLDRLITTNDRARWLTFPGATPAQTAVGAVKVNEWHHFVGTYDTTGTALQLFRDGGAAVTATSSLTVPDGTQPFKLCGNSGTNRLIGQIDGAFVDNVVWNQAQACRACSIDLDGALGWCVGSAFKACTTDADCNGRTGACDATAGTCTGRNRTDCGSCSLPTCDAAAP